MTPPAKSPDDLIWECVERAWTERIALTGGAVSIWRPWDEMPQSYKDRERAIWLASVGPIFGLKEFDSAAWDKELLAHDHNGVCFMMRSHVDPVDPETEHWLCTIEDLEALCRAVKGEGK
jgi:hypothetical protein